MQKPEDRGDADPAGTDAARKRADSLTSKKPRQETDEKPSGKERPEGSRPVLTEKQRIEARRARQARRRRPVKGNPISKGMRATGFEVKRTAAFLGNSVLAGLAALGPVFSSAGMGLVWLLEQAGRGLKAFGRLVVRASAAAGRTVVALDQVLTPHRALILVAGIAAILLGVSQYKALGAIEIGQPGYAGIEDLARAPAIDRTTPAGVHTQILVPIAAVAFAAVVMIALGSVASFSARFARWRRLAAMTLVTIGLLSLIVTLLIDLPRATDTTEAAIAYADVGAVLLSGFWLELAAGAALGIAGLALLLEPAPGRAPEKRRQRQSSRVRDRTQATGSRA